MNDRQSFATTIAADLREADRLENRPTGYDGAKDLLIRNSRQIEANQLRSNTAAYLVFADWLEEQGDPWAELIRVGCELMSHKTCCSTTAYSFGRCRLLREREHELQQQLNPFSDRVKVTWDRRLIVGVSVGTTSWRFMIDELQVDNSPFKEQPICIIRLSDWQGIERSLPRNPAEALPHLFKLELPYPNEGEGWSYYPGSTSGVTQEIQSIVKAFGLLNGKPRVRVEFWGDTEHLQRDYRRTTTRQPQFPDPWTSRRS